MRLRDSPLPQSHTETKLRQPVTELWGCGGCGLGEGHQHLSGSTCRWGFLVGHHPNAQKMGAHLSCLPLNRGRSRWWSPFSGWPVAAAAALSFYKLLLLSGPQPHSAKWVWQPLACKGRRGDVPARGWHPTSKSELPLSGGGRFWASPCSSWDPLVRHLGQLASCQPSVTAGALHKPLVISPTVPHAPLWPLALPGTLTDPCVTRFTSPSQARPLRAPTPAHVPPCACCRKELMNWSFQRALSPVKKLEW